MNTESLKKTVMETKVSNFPAPISAERVNELIHQKGIAPEIAAIDLEMVKMKLKTENGEAWSDEQCQSAEVEYKRYLQLCKMYGKGMVPNRIIDSIWHYHILDTRAYAEDCQKVFGHFLHHYPYFGLRDEEEAKALKEAFERTKNLYFQTFGERMDRGGEEMDCWHDCEDRCWHDCSSLF